MPFEIEPATIQRAAARSGKSGSAEKIIAPSPHSRVTLTSVTSNGPSLDRTQADQSPPPHAKRRSLRGGAIYWPELIAIGAFSVSWLVKGEVRDLATEAGKRALNRVAPGHVDPKR